jgi:hypothetical protein
VSAATFLAYVDAVPGRLYPLVATLLEPRGRVRRALGLRPGAERVAFAAAGGAPAAADVLEELVRHPTTMAPAARAVVPEERSFR